MHVINTNILDVKIIEPKVFGDDRGFLLETFRDDWFRENIADVTFVQDNHSKSLKGVLRGLHYQREQPQGKLIRVVTGVVYDVAVDLRSNSATFGQHVTTVLSGENNKQIWVPAGFAHGFYVMSESAEFVYKCTNYYAPEHEVSLLWNDPVLAIQWPIVNGLTPILSAKDKLGLLFEHTPKF